MNDYVIAIPSYKRNETLKKKTMKVLDEYNISPNKIYVFVADENEMDIHLENLLKKHKHLDKVTTKVLEINPDHEIIKYLAKLDFSKDENKTISSDISEMLLNQAKIIEGIPLEDSKAFCNNINKLLIKNID